MKYLYPQCECFTCKMDWNSSKTVIWSCYLNQNPVEININANLLANGNATGFVLSLPGGTNITLIVLLLTLPEIRDRDRRLKFGSDRHRSPWWLQNKAVKINRWWLVVISLFVSVLLSLLCVHSLNGVNQYVLLCDITVHSTVCQWCS